MPQLPLDERKIDGCFVRFAYQNRSDGVLVRSTANLAHELGLKVVAEGAEDEECRAFLRSIGCDLVQEYVISRPASAERVADMLARPLAAAA